MADESTNYEINVVGNEQGLKEAASAIVDTADASREAARALQAHAKSGERAEKAIASLTKVQEQANKAVKDGLSGLSEYQRESAKLAGLSSNVRLDPKGNARYVDTGRQLSKKAVQEELAVHQQITQELDRQEAELKAQMAVRKENLRLMREARQAGGYAPANSGPQTGTGQGSAKAVADRFSGSGLFAEQDAKAAREAADAIARVKDENVKAAEAALLHANRLTNMRYSLYEVSNTASLTAAALIGVNVGTLAAAATYETAMAQISRTSGITGEQLNVLRGDFVDLAQTIPTAFSDLAEIGTLAGQLNIPADRIAAFTETTAKFTATTNVAAEQSATAFGRLDALLDDVNGNYEALGSSILNVGVNSVATETEIIATTNQITAASQQAGFAAKEIIGLAASFASLGVAPEAARGTIIRVFSTINTAVSSGNENLNKLAALAGQSAEQFAAAWEGDPATAFQAVLSGMQKAGEAGTNLENVVRSMGITAVRDINALLKLGQNADIVASNFQYAADGFDEATQLGEAFDTQAATLASKLQVLANSFQGLFATLGQSGLGPVGALVDLLNGTLQVITDLASSPFVQWSAAVVGGVTALAAVAALVVVGISRLAASFIAGSQAIAAFRVEVAQATSQTLTFKSAMDYASTSMTGSATAAKVLRGALLGLGVFGAIAVAGGIVATVIDNVSNSMKSAEQKALDYYGSLDDLGTALSADTEAAKEGGVVYGTVDGSLTRVTRSTADWAVALTNATGAQVTAEGAIEETTGATENQTLKIGENTAAWLASKLATDEAVISFLRFAEEMENSAGVELDQKGFLTALSRNDVDQAKSILEEYKQALIAATTVGGDSLTDIADDELYNQAIEAINGMAEAIERNDGAIKSAAEQTEIYNQILEINGQSATNAANAAKYGADALDEYGGAASAASDYAKLLGDQVANAFSNQNTMGQWVTDAYALAEGIATGGTAFDYLGQAGIANMSNLQTSIVSTIMAGASLGMSTAESVGSLFLYLQELGVDTANLMAQVAAAAGVPLSVLQQAVEKPTAQMQYMADTLGQIQANANAAAGAVGRGGGGSGGPGIANAAEDAQKEVRTLVDYANDLWEIVDRAWEIRFSVEVAQDDANSAFNQMVEDADEAREKVKDLRGDIKGLEAELTGLKAERNSLNYFLDVAVEYGDDLRATEIGGEIAEVEAEIGDTRSDLSKKNKDLTKAQDALSTSTKGNSQAAIENRRKLRELQQAHLDSIKAFAATGASQKEIADFTAKAEQKFRDQAAALGYSKSQTDKYAEAFDDVAVAINNVPRNITVSASTNPALQALNEFNAKATSRGKTGGSNYKRGFNAGVSGITLPKLPSWKPLGDKKAREFKRGFNDQTKTWQTRDKTTGEWIRTGVNLYKTGGYTGNGGESKIAGMVHGKEFVVNAENTAKFRPILEAMNKGQMPAMGIPVPGAGSGYVELSPTDRAILRELRNVQIAVNGRVLGEVTNAANFQTNRRGAS